MRCSDTRYKFHTNLDRLLAGHGMELQQPDVPVHLEDGAHDHSMKRLFA